MVKRTAMPYPGQPFDTPIPARLNRWNWGAFFLNWIWGIGNNTWIALLMFVPFINVVMLIALGVKGSDWAWRNNLWRDEEHFRRNQRRWAIAGVLSWVVVFALVAYSATSLLGFMKNTEVYRMSMQEITNSPAIESVFGKPIEAGWFVTGKVTVAMSGGGQAALNIPLSGPKSSGSAIVQAERVDGKWVLNLLVVRPDKDRPPIVLTNRKNIPIPGQATEI